MRLTPRKNEYGAVLALLEAEGEFDTLEDLAKYIVAVVAQEFTKRDWYAYAWKDVAYPSSPSIAWGPFTSAHEVTKFHEKQALGGKGISVKLYSVDAQEAVLNELVEKYGEPAPVPE